MSETEVSEIFKLLQGGANGAIIALALVAISVARAFLKALRDLREDQSKHHALVIASQESIKRAIIAGNPRAEAIFRDEDLRRAGGA